MTSAFPDPEEFVQPDPETPAEHSAIAEVLRAAGALPPDEPWPPVERIPNLPTHEIQSPFPEEPDPALEFEPEPAPAPVLEIIEPSLLLTESGEVIAPPPPPPAGPTGPAPLLASINLPTALLLYAAAYGPWALSFGVLSLFVGWDPPVDPWWQLFTAAWIACFLGTNFALYAQALLGYAAPGLHPNALRGVLLLSALIFGGSTWLMSSGALYNHPGWILVNSLGLLALASGLGFAIAREIQHSGHLIAVAVVGLTVDLWSVYRGPSREIATSVIAAVEDGVYTGEVAPPLVSFLLLRFPVPGVEEIQAMLGAGDLVFLAFFFGCVIRFGLPPMVNYLGLTLGTVGALLLVNIFAPMLQARFGISALPALPILAPLFILLNFRHLYMSPREWRLTGLFVAILLAIMLTVTGIQIVQQMGG